MPFPVGLPLFESREKEKRADFLISWKICYVTLSFTTPLLKCVLIIGNKFIKTWINEKT